MFQLGIYYKSNLRKLLDNIQPYLLIWQISIYLDGTKQPAARVCLPFVSHSEANLKNLF